MSFSFNVKATSLVAAIALATSKMDEVVVQQPGHKADRDAVLGTIDVYSKLVNVDDSKDVSIHVNGSLGGAYQSDGTYSSISSANVGVGIHMVDREKPAA